MAKKEDFSEEMDRREYRRKRRIRNQLISYIVLAVILVGLVIGGIIGVQKILKMLNEKKDAEEMQKQLQELMEGEEEPAVVEAPEERPEPEEETDYLDEIVNPSIEAMPLEDKVAGLFFITPEALTDTDVVVRAGDTTKEKLREYAVGGLIYFSQNIKDSAQLTEMLQNTQNWVKYPTFLGVDEEGGSVTRVAKAGLADDVGPMAEIGASEDTALAKEAGAAIGTYLTGYGFNMDFAPVADVIVEGNTIIGDRSFGTDADKVSSMAAAMVEGLQENGVSACLKHFPGLGDTTQDTHEGLAASDKTLDNFTEKDFPVYRAGIDAGVDFIMVSHLSAPNVVGDNTPASLSSVMITDILRGQLGYQGIVITDALNMTAITDYYTPEEAAVKALQAGADMILMPEDFKAAYQGVLDAVNDGTLTEERIDESLRRIYRVKKYEEYENIMGQ
ncbi:MAG: glycoside hydrolase family 3 protein [Lachnospiraceae bacterium]|nr:glycoside hydrolase family 3 protein [Lachnospiraceae bacterium]